ncbi:hypothetical protein HF888_08405 [Bermanella marisrubri]|uniref:Uncharacterized protein n=1 Tax=Bermanella marisrubri TaxID=207949 RepID=Q1MXV2_9GAMM|nr:hypothetical protein [Bermanella marisrubri]EAT10785.1 hypothetical protein RED65_08639 [Oceanobacter sp. RED65] [Bermanella marisrubri]QIZ84247.1 hypothetical protein HF888_08405 [Bermanella marisrubri]
MNTASTFQGSNNQAAWALWVSPSSSDLKQLRLSQPEEKNRTLLLHPKDWDVTVTAIESAIETGFYKSIRLPKSRFHSLQKQKLELIALRNNVTLTWISEFSELNAANQLSLL